MIHQAVRRTHIIEPAQGRSIDSVSPTHSIKLRTPSRDAVPAVPLFSSWSAPGSVRPRSDHYMRPAQVRAGEGAIFGLVSVPSTPAIIPETSTNSLLGSVSTATWSDMTNFRIRQGMRRSRIGAVSRLALTAFTESHFPLASILFFSF